MSAEGMFCEKCPAGTCNCGRSGPKCCSADCRCPGCKENCACFTSSWTCPKGGCSIENCKCTDGCACGEGCACPRCVGCKCSGSNWVCRVECQTGSCCGTPACKCSGSCPCPKCRKCSCESLTGTCKCGKGCTKPANCKCGAGCSCK